MLGTSGPWSNNQLPRYAFASLPAANAVPVGYRVIATNLGANGTELISNGTRWRPIAGIAVLKDLGAPVSGIANSEVIRLQTLLPANALQVNDTLRIWLALAKSGATDYGLVTVRMGTAGTTGDTAITSLSAAIELGAVSISGAAIFDIKLISATSAQRIGTGAAQTGTYTTLVNTSAAAAATTISSVSANPIYVSASAYSSSTNDTITIQSGQIQLITP